tara:strand:+ start:760 stop:1341 length:582 start_codon:yes stop_codon:yes gene_type:complete
MPAISETIGTVKSVNIDYDVEKNWGNWNPVWNIFLTVKYNDGQSWDKELEVYGNVKKNLPITDQKSWGSAFKVRTFFESCTGKRSIAMKDDYTVPESLFDEVIGKQFMVASYKTNKVKRNGKPFWNTYSIVAPPNALPGTLQNKILKDVEGDYIKNYQSDDPSTDFDYGNNANGQKAETTEPEKETANFDLDI